MFKKKIVAAVLLGVVPLMLMVLQVSFAGAADVPGSFTFTPDDQRGYMTLENDVVKVVWHYKILSEERNNRGGGSIYELYDKRTDPEASNNMAALLDAGGGATTPNMPGIGGLGAMHIWELGEGVSAADNGRFTSLVGQNHHFDSEGNGVFETEFIVKSSLWQWEGKENRPQNYRVKKIWTVHPDGQIKLDINVEILRDFMASEPAYDFSFSQDYGWTTASSLGHNWGKSGIPGSSGTTNPYNTLSVIENLQTTPDYDYQLLHSEFFSLYGRPGGSTVRIKMDNDGKGFENGGLYKLGYDIWGNAMNATVEYSKYRNAAYGNTVRFFGWWGGAPPQAPRHKQLLRGTTWSDTIWIELMPSQTPEAPQVYPGQAVTNLSPGTALLQWKTDIASDARVSLTKEGESTGASHISSSWTPSHRMMLENLVPGATYHYEAQSGDGSGEVFLSGSFVAMRASGVDLHLSQAVPQWSSYADYQRRLLSVDFDITNSGTGTATAAEVIQASASGARVVQVRNLQLGEMAPGDTGSVQIIFEVPSGVSSFSAHIFLRAVDEDGNYLYFPGPPPS